MDTLQSLWEQAIANGASDVHLVAGQPVMYRISGQLVAQGETILTAEDTDKTAKAVLGVAGYKELTDRKDSDRSFELKDGVRLRVNCHYAGGTIGIAARVIPSEIPTPEQLGLAEEFKWISALRDGLVLFTGPTGAGKSTSLAAILHSINQTRTENIVTLEDPVEFVFPKGQGIVRQRQYGDDFISFADALKHVLRQDPNIVMVGEMRDPETIAAALTLAETGHLIFATLHTPNAVQAVDRIIDVFPPHQQPQVRSQLSLSLKAIVAQTLVPAAAGGRTALREVLVNTPAVGNTIRDGRMQELKSVLQTGKEQGMRTFEDDAKRLYKAGVISKEVYEWVVG